VMSWLLNYPRSSVASGVCLRRVPKREGYPALVEMGNRIGGAMALCQPKRYFLKKSTKIILEWERAFHASR
jgi:hypothetical protein